MLSKIYLGDAVYACVDPDEGLTLTTENGIETTNIIVLEPAVLQALLRFVVQQWPEAVEDVLDMY